MRINRILLLAALACLTACSEEPTLDLIGMVDGQSPAADERFAGDKDAGLVQGLGPKIVVSPTGGYKVYVGTDMHIASASSTRHTDTFLEAFSADGDAPMALLLGDLVDGSSSMQAASARVREMAGEKAGHVFPALGNHDIYFNLWEAWSREWGDAHYTVQVSTPEGVDLYICLDSASGHLGRSQMAWLKDVLDIAVKRGFRHVIVYTHTHMFKKDGSQGHTSNYPVEETWELTSLFADSGVELFLSGHCHSRDISYFNGVEYVVVDALEEDCPDSETGYMVLEVGDNLDCRFTLFGSN